MINKSTVSILPLSSVTVNSAPLGLLGLGLTALLFGVHLTGLFTVNSQVLATCMFYGGAGQILVGIMEWRRQHTFCAVTCTAFGLFWISLIALIILPEGHSGAAPQTTELVSYLAMWGLFSFIFLINAQVPLPLKLVFAGISGMILTLAAAISLASPALQILAGSFGLLAAVMALYAAMTPPLRQFFASTSKS
ncbi:MAG: acetate uptake transporter [Desulfuromonadales bacterium]|nr:acetate uptake transporter [Desulfuromonadales bacterium]MDW7757782.1 acetate uptake transporter [Desulfuromonadales bacterium]